MDLADHISLFFACEIERGKPEYQEKISQSRVRNQQTQSTHGVEHGIESRPHWWKGGCFQQRANPTLPGKKPTRRTGNNWKWEIIFMQYTSKYGFVLALKEDNLTILVLH